ncbi:hypothetical protein [Alkalitalea saponilacus]|uniref:Uncharacterized protein n=1 Tax=Alkalitalea saponilacus TaxID=889453 RepID=A0A1T5HST8_9BACT|nr:hypothetical protein [Alkalitalea saponilacus]ASB49280.1 hypothetical protein CDL62_09065 [Alkalitalea saponilacus]SKC23764.1 hypothetical protein SAMN03080601_03049 [Alkalitalea saponilacus]
MKEKRGSFNDRVLLIVQNILAVLLLLVALLTADNLLSFSIIFLGVTIGTNIAYFSKNRYRLILDKKVKNFFFANTFLLALIMMFIYLKMNTIWIIALLMTLIISIAFSFVVILNRKK